jgi:uncharacterized protein YidB (DUF937 family)
MGLFDAIAGQVAGALSNQGDASSSGILGAVMGMVNNPDTGGLQGLISTFQEKGLGGVVQSWVSTGQNLPISAEQLSSVLGSEQIQGIAQKLGLSTDDVASHLSNLLPQVVDKITPDGTVPEGDALQQAVGMLGGLFK